jgi:hypothetical protein
LLVNVVAVIADIVDSRGIPDRPNFQRRLDTLLGRMSKRSRRHLLSPFTITLGDEFQAVYGGFEAVLDDAVEIIAEVYPLRLRMALGHGPLSTDLNPTAALGMDGPCFAAARELLTRLKKEERNIVQVSAAAGIDLALENLSLRLFADAIEGWKHNSLKILARSLWGNSTEELAQQLGITRRGINKNIASHNISDYVELIRLLSRRLPQVVPA